MLTDRPSFKMTRASDTDDFDVKITNLEGGIAQLKKAGEAPRDPDSRMPRVLVVTDCDVESNVHAALELGLLGYAFFGCRLYRFVSAVRQWSNILVVYASEPRPVWKTVQRAKPSHREKGRSRSDDSGPHQYAQILM